MVITEQHMDLLQPSAQEWIRSTGPIEEITGIEVRQAPVFAGVVNGFKKYLPGPMVDLTVQRGDKLFFQSFVIADGEWIIKPNQEGKR